MVLGLCLLFICAGSALAVTPVNLGTASGFAILAGSAITNTGSSYIVGDLGLSPGTAVSGFPPGTLVGVQYIAEAVALQAQNDLTTAYNDAAGRSPVTTIATELGGATLVPGVYNSASGTFGITGTLTLDAQADPNAVFIFQMQSTLITATSSRVELIRGAQACNVFWQVGSSATLGTYSNLKGSILALTSITLTTAAVVEGKVMARNGAVTIDSDTINCVICACVPNSQVLLIPNNPVYPGEQNVHACAQLSAAAITEVIVPVYGIHNIPSMSIASGCPDCGDPTCEGVSDWVLGAWTFMTTPPQYVANLSAGAGATGCCVCLHLDYVLPVELLSFEGAPGDNTVDLSWTTASELNAGHFEILRDGQTTAHVAAANSATGANYHWTDESVQNGTTYRYDLVAVDMNQIRQNLSYINVTPSLDAGNVKEYSLHQNYPNPFNPTTNIAIELVEGGYLTLTVYNLMGQEVAGLFSGNMDRGRHVVSFEAGQLPSGVYVYRAIVNGFVAEKKMLLLK
jgi:hypothetical protein